MAGAVAAEPSTGHIRSNKLKGDQFAILCCPSPRYTRQGKYYQVDGITIAPRPLQRPHPPVHVAVSRTAASIDIAVARDIPVLTTYFTPV